MSKGTEREELVGLVYALEGVITDVKYGNGFDEVCLQTIERVKEALSSGRALLSQESASKSKLATEYSRETWMQAWDQWRSYFAKGGGASWPRDAFECLLDYVEELIEQEPAASAVGSDVPQDTLDRLLIGKATEGDQMLAHNALAQASMEGAIVSVDVSTGEGDAYNRIFAKIIDWQEDSAEGRVYLAVEEGRNFTAASAVGEGWALVLIERGYDARAKQLIAFNTCDGDLDDKLDAAHKAMLAADHSLAAAPTAAKIDSLFLTNLHYFFAQTDGSYKWPEGSIGDLLKQAKQEIEAKTDKEGCDE